jgi:hypothetical protein
VVVLVEGVELVALPAPPLLPVPAPPGLAPVPLEPPIVLPPLPLPVPPALELSPEPLVVPPEPLVDPAVPPGAAPGEVGDEVVLAGPSALRLQATRDSAAATASARVRLRDGPVVVPEGFIRGSLDGWVSGVCFKRCNSR